MCGSVRRSFLVLPPLHHEMTTTIIIWSTIHVHQFWVSVFFVVCAIFSHDWAELSFYFISFHFSLLGFFHLSLVSFFFCYSFLSEGERERDTHTQSKKWGVATNWSLYLSWHLHTIHSSLLHFSAKPIIPFPFSFPFGHSSTC